MLPKQIFAVLLFSILFFVKHSFCMQQNWHRKASNTPGVLSFHKNSVELTFSKKGRIIINLIGTVGSGKGTQAEKLFKRYGLLQISLGDEFRAIREGSALDKTNKFIKEHGFDRQFDHIRIAMMVIKFASEEYSGGFILDGFPRSEEQARAFINSLVHPSDLHIPILLEVSSETVKERVRKRYHCRTCDLQMNIEHEAPKICYRCQRNIDQRPEDKNLAKLDERLTWFEKAKNPIVNQLAIRDRVTVIDGSKDPEEIFGEITQIIEQALDKRSEEQAGKYHFTEHLLEIFLMGLASATN